MVLHLDINDSNKLHYKKGFGKSKLLKNLRIYECTITQRACIVQDFLSTLIPNRKMYIVFEIMKPFINCLKLLLLRPLNSVIGFGDSSYVVPFLSQIYGDCMNSLTHALVNPTPPNFIRF